MRGETWPKRLAHVCLSWHGRLAHACRPQGRQYRRAKARRAQAGRLCHLLLLLREREEAFVLVYLDGVAFFEASLQQLHGQLVLQLLLDHSLHRPGA